MGQEEVRQLEVNDLVWIVDENVKRAHYKISRLLEVYHGSDGNNSRSALVKTEDGKLKRQVVKLALLFHESDFGEKNRASNVGACHQQAEKVDWEHAGWETRLKSLEIYMKIWRKVVVIISKPPTNWFFSTTTANLRAMKLGTHMQVPNTDTLTKFPGHSPP